jgi:hypothetical protein
MNEQQYSLIRIHFSIYLIEYQKKWKLQCGKTEREGGRGECYTTLNYIRKKKKKNNRNENKQ